ncbi:hypothetical protein FOCC_FOCC007123 [Frankliniella occidentalis]|nr:hypothetical protein FOCC_FOCC007123 [Frankliniella occidentalis]
MILLVGPIKIQSEKREKARERQRKRRRCQTSEQKELERARASERMQDNNMDPKSQSSELIGLTYIEKQLICRVHSVFSIYKVNKGQSNYRGQVINFPQNIQTEAERLPHLVADLDNLIVVKLSSDIDLKDFHVRKDKVLQALLWLKENNPMYSDVVIDDDGMCALPEEGSILHELSDVLPDHNDSDDETTDHSSDDQGLFCSSGVPALKDPSLNNTLNYTLLWPQIVYRYIAKYASKSEVKLETYYAIMTQILDKKCVEGEHCKQAVRKLLLSTCAERDYCAQEVVRFLMGYHFYNKSRDFVTINLKNRDWVSISYGYGSNNVIDNYIA